MSSSTRPTLPNTRDPRMGSLNNILITSLNGATRAGDYNKDKLRVKYFYRDRSKLRNFLTQLKVIFKLELDKYNISPKKVMYIALLLRGSV